MNGEVNERLLLEGWAGLRSTPTILHSKTAMEVEDYA
jgi:hypothetical protein